MNARLFKTPPRFIKLSAVIAAMAAGLALAATGAFTPSVSASVGTVQTECDVLHLDGAVQCEIFAHSPSDFLEIRVTLEQFGCEVTGRLEVASPSIAGSGRLHRVIDGNFIRFQMPGEANDPGRDINFSGLIDGDQIFGQYSIPEGEVSSFRAESGNGRQCPWKISQTPAPSPSPFGSYSTNRRLSRRF